MDMENLLMEMVMQSTRRDRAGEMHPHGENVPHEGRRPKLRERRRQARRGERTEPQVSLRRPQGVPARASGLVLAVRRFLKLG
jgi:hypothetical protein